MKIVLAVLLCLSVTAQPSPNCAYPRSKCPSINPMKVVDFEKYGGIWQEYYHGTNVNYQCAEFNYQYLQTCYNMTTDATDKNGKKFQGISDVKLDDTSCAVPFMDYVEGDDTIGNSNTGFLPGQLDIFVLYTDYVTYTVEYGCSLKDGKPDQTLCVQARKGKKPPPDEDIKKLLVDNNIDPEILTVSCNSWPK